MANKFKMGSNEYAIPKQAEPYTDEQFKAKQDMYDAIEYETLKDEEGYVSQEEVSEDTKKMLKEFKRKKIGASAFDFFRRIA